jgi:hypothetical protein
MTQEFTQIEYPKDRDWVREYAIRQFENAMASNSRIDTRWTIQTDTGSLYCGDRIDYERMIYTVLIPTR